MRRCLVTLSLLAMALPATAEAAADRDRDRLPDRWEKRFHISTVRASAEGDPDRDRVDNLNEHRQGTNPRDRDSDNDRRPDGREDRDRDALSNAAEDLTGNDPLDPDTDDDGVRDGAERAGTVISFEDGELAVHLGGGGVLRGFANDSTDVRCSSERHLEKGHKAKKRKRGHGSRARSSTTEEDPGAPEDDPFSDEPWDDENDPDAFEDELEDDKADEDKDSKADSDEGGAKACGLSRLRPGARIHQATLELTGDGLFFKKIKLIR